MEATVEFYRACNAQLYKLFSKYGISAAFTFQCILCEMRNSPISRHVINAPDEAGSDKSESCSKGNLDPIGTNLTRLSGSALVGILTGDRETVEK